MPETVNCYSVDSCLSPVVPLCGCCVSAETYSIWFTNSQLTRPSVSQGKRFSFSSSSFFFFFAGMGLVNCLVRHLSALDLQTVKFKYVNLMVEFKALWPCMSKTNKQKLQQFAGMFNRNDKNKKKGRKQERKKEEEDWDKEREERRHVTSPAVKTSVVHYLLSAGSHRLSRRSGFRTSRAICKNTTSDSCVILCPLNLHSPSQSLHAGQTASRRAKGEITPKVAYWPHCVTDDYNTFDFFSGS